MNHFDNLAQGDSNFVIMSSIFKFKQRLHHLSPFHQQRIRKRIKKALMHAIQDLNHIDPKKVNVVLTLLIQ